MSDSKPILRDVMGVERSHALTQRDAILPNLNVPREITPKRRLDKARIVYEYGGIAFTRPDHYDALSYASQGLGESEAYIHHPNKGLDIVAVDLAAFADVIRASEVVFSSEGEPLVPGQDWSTEELALLQPPFVDEWSIFSTNGDWIYSSFMAGDENAMAGSAQFMADYLEARPSVARDCVAWVLGDGSIMENAEKADSFWRRMRVSPEIDRYEGSHLESYLNSMYSEPVSLEIWDMAKRVEALDRPFSKVRHTPDERLERLIEDDPAVVERLRQIWLD